MVATTSPDRTVENLPCRLHFSTLVEAGIDNLIGCINGLIGSSLLNESIAIGHSDKHPLCVEVIGQKFATLLGADGCVVAIAAVDAALRIERHEGIGIVGLYDVVAAVSKVDETPCTSLTAVHVATIGEVLAGIIVGTAVAQASVDVEVGSNVRTIGLLFAFSGFLGSLNVLQCEQCARHTHGSMCTPVGTTGEETLLTNVVEIELTSLNTVTAEHVRLTLGMVVLAGIAQMAQGAVEVALVGGVGNGISSLVGVETFAAGQIDSLFQRVNSAAVDGAGIVICITQSLKGIALGSHVVACSSLAGSIQCLLEQCHQGIGSGSAVVLDLGNEVIELWLVNIDDRIALGIL